MPRTKSIPDTEVLAVVRALLASGGDKAISFGAVARSTNLAPSTLAQRFGTVDAMRNAALNAGWQDLTEATLTAVNASADKGTQGLLKSLEPFAPTVRALLPTATTDAARAQAAGWRQVVETALAYRLGQGEKSREAATVLFALKIKDIAKKLA